MSCLLLLFHATYYSRHIRLALFAVYKLHTRDWDRDVVPPSSLDYSPSRDPDRQVSQSKPIESFLERAIS